MFQIVDLTVCDNIGGGYLQKFGACEFIYIVTFIIDIIVTSFNFSSFPLGLSMKSFLPALKSMASFSLIVVRYILICVRITGSVSI